MIYPWLHSHRVFELVVAWRKKRAGHFSIAPTLWSKALGPCSQYQQVDEMTDCISPRTQPEFVWERARIAQKLVSAKQDIAQAVTGDFFFKHPDSTTRYGERGRELCTADACFHVAFLAGAIEAGSPEMFGDYMRWTARMLGARGIAAHTLEENLDHLGKHLPSVLLPDESQEVLTFLTRARQAYFSPETASRTQQSGGSLALVSRVYLAAILSGQREAAINIIEEALQASHSHVDIYVDVFAEAQHRVGDLWELNKITVAQEHAATSITEAAIAAIYPRQVSSATYRGSMAVAGVLGEEHQIGANLFAKIMEANGWKTRFLGTNLPHASVLAALETSAVDVLCISTTLVSNLPAAVGLVRTVRNKFKKAPLKIILGGAAFKLASARFAQEVGADDVTDLRGALTILCGQNFRYSAKAAQ